MKRFYALFIAVCLVFALTACTAAPGSFPWGLYTEAPAATEAGEAPEVPHAGSAAGGGTGISAWR